MKIVFPKETYANETRIAGIPSVIEKFTKLGLEVCIEKGLAEHLSIPDEAFEKAGANVEADRKKLFSTADIVLHVRKPEIADISLMKKGAYHISFYDAYQDHELTKAFKNQGITALSMEMMPRTTLAQKMDALSSQANLGGYVAVIIAAEKLHKVFPMMTTPAGTISPVSVFVIGVGVAGLQAIATAKRLGARVEAFDTRPVVEEQVKSLGAKFVKIDLGETGQTKDGYAKALTDEQLKIQREAMAKVCARSDIVITTAQLVGRKAPVIVTDEMIAGMQPGSVIVDMAVEGGGNVEGSQFNLSKEIHGVHVIGLGNLPGRVAVHASQVYSSNLYHLIHHVWDQQEKKINAKDDLFHSCIITKDHEIVHERIKTIG